MTRPSSNLSFLSPLRGVPAAPERSTCARRTRSPVKRSARAALAAGFALALSGFVPLPLFSALGASHAAKPTVGLAHTAPALADVPEDEGGLAQAPAEAADDAPAYDAATVLARLQAMYDGMQDYSATFEQVHTNLAAGDERRLSGTVYFLRPGMMRWDYVAPEPKHLIANGDRFWSVEPARGQYFEGSLDAAQLPTALRFLMGEGQLSEDFEVALRDSSTGETASLELVPRAPSPDYDHLVFLVDVASGRLEAVEVVDPLGNVNAFAFDGAAFDSGFDAGSFAYVPTPDMVRIETPN